MGRCKQKQLGLRGYYVAGRPLLNGRCTSLLRAPVSEMTYTVLSGTLNSIIPIPDGGDLSVTRCKWFACHTVRIVITALLSSVAVVKPQWIEVLASVWPCYTGNCHYMSVA